VPERCCNWWHANGARCDRDWRELEPGGPADEAAAVWKAEEEARVAAAQAELKRMATA
jgi:hypothetical protein